MTDQLTGRERRQVERLAHGSRLVESLAVASLSLRKLRKDLPRGLPFGLLFDDELFWNIASGKMKGWRKWLAKRADAAS